MTRFHRVKGLMTGNVYIIESGEVVLVDAGGPQDHRLVARRLKGLGRSLSDVRHILITHFHVDHAGAAAALKELSGATVYAHSGDAPILQGDEAMPSVYSRGAVGKAASSVPGVSERIASVPPVRVDVWLEDGDVVPALGGVRLIHAPGHTPGNSCYLWEREGILFSGDAIINTFHFFTLPTNGFSCDFSMAARSACGVVDRVVMERLEVVCPGHGPAVSGDPLEKLVRFKKRTERSV